MSERLHIVMPFTRPGNLDRLAQYYLVDMESHPFELRWHLMVQGPEPDPKGLNKVNEALRMFNTGWVWAPSDDAIHERELFRRLSEVAQVHPAAGAIVFSERRRGVIPWTGQPWPSGEGVLRACPAEMHPCHIDGSQVFFRAELLRGIQLDTRRWPGEADGHFIVEVYKRFPLRFIFVDEPLIKFNSLEW